MRETTAREAVNPPQARSDDDENISLCELLDRVLNKGVVVRGDIVISVADVDLLYLGVQLVLSSTETARRAGLVLPHDMTRTRRDIERVSALERAERSLPSASDRDRSDS